MGFGSSNKTPDPEPIPPVPSRDHPNRLEVEKQAQTRAKSQKGYGGHLLSGGHKGDTSSGGTSKPSLIG